MAKIKTRKEAEEHGATRFNVYLNPELRKALRMQALEEGVSATRLVERLITEYLKKKRRAVK